MGMPMGTHFVQWNCFFSGSVFFHSGYEQVIHARSLCTKPLLVGIVGFPRKKKNTLDKMVIWRFPQMGVPQNHPFPDWDFVVDTIHLRVTPFTVIYRNPHMMLYVSSFTSRVQPKDLCCQRHVRQSKKTRSARKWLMQHNSTSNTVSCSD